ncbi:MAG TPA: CDP-alcohol phosphatidyltransferase family protein [Pyrinomonadaceae bacterium]|nr:CDP-alcohol phosphatidyltransferase family protein [Pyrinomonadaceae bacterium]
MFGASIGRGAKRIIDAIVRWLAFGGVHPNILTVIGVIISVVCGILFGVGEFFWAGVVLIVANLFDMLDGNVARLTGRVTRFGGFLDSSLDRLSDMVAFLGIMVFYASNTPQRSVLNVFLAGLGLIGSVMVSYTTARSESLGVKANVGFLQRPERIVLLIIGALSTFPNSDFFLANRMPQVLWILAIGSFWTFIHRMYFTWKEFRKLEAAA